MKEIKNHENKEKSASLPQEKVNPTAFIYIGPTIKGKIEKNTAFKNGCPPRLKELTEEYPFIRELVIPVNKIAERVKEAREQGTQLNVIYNQAKKITEGKNDGI